MAKLTKVQRRNHEKALEILKQDILSESDKEFVFNHYHEGATNNNGDAGAFFTSLEVAAMAAHDCVGDGLVSNRRVIDLCAGIGVLAYQILKRYDGVKVVCVEYNPEYVAIGKKLVPEADWYCADVMDKDFILSLGEFDNAISNPPFGKVRTFKNKQGFYYKGGEAEYKVMDIASVIANNFTFIVPQVSAGFKYSGVHYYERVESNKYKMFCEQVDFELEAGMGYDTTYSQYGESKIFKDVSIPVELANAYTDHIEPPKKEIEFLRVLENEHIEVSQEQQLSLF